MVKKILFFCFFVFVVLLFHNSINAGIQFDFTVNVNSDMGEALSGAEIYDQDNTLLGKTDENGIFHKIFYDELPESLLIYKQSYQKVLIFLKQKSVIILNINLQPVVTITENEIPFHGTAYVNKKPLSNKSFFIKSKGLMKEVWTDKQGRFTSYLPENNYYMLFYPQEDYEDNYIIQNIYIEKIENIDEKSNENYIYFSDFQKKSVSFANQVKNPQLFSLIFTSQSCYFGFNGGYTQNKYYNHLKLNLYSTNDKIFKEYLMFFQITYFLGKIKSVDLIENLEKDQYDYQDDVPGTVESLLNYDVDLVLNKKDQKAEIILYNMEAFEDELRTITFYDGYQNGLLTVYSYTDRFYISSSLINKAQFASIGIYYNKYLSYDQFMDDYHLKTSASLQILNIYFNID